MKKLLLLFLILTTSLSFGQNLEALSDQELLSFLSSAQAQGLSISEVKTLAKAKGASESDIAKAMGRIKELNTNVKSNTDNKISNTGTQVDFNGCQNKFFEIRRSVLIK